MLFQLWRPFTSPIVRETRPRTRREAAREAECKNFTLFVNPPSVSHAMKLRARARTTLKWTDEIHREKQNLAVRLACARGSFLHLQAHNKLSLEIASCRPFLSLVSVLSLSPNSSWHEIPDKLEDETRISIMQNYPFAERSVRGRRRENPPSLLPSEGQFFIGNNLT